jgi:DNA-directed RNA polymerase I and III subunit RPAC2
MPFLDSSQVDFCGYSIPHPSEAKMNVRIQTTGKVGF